MNLEKLIRPESIAKFLEEQEGVKVDFTKPHELCVNRFSFQRKGRDETLHKIYDCIVEISAMVYSFKYLYILHIR